MIFKTAYIDEPDLIFGGKGEEKDPRYGLSYYGPYFYADEAAPLSSLRVGIIGDRSMINKTIEILKLIQNEVKSSEPNKWLYPHFPGISTNSPFKCSLSYPVNWQEVLSEDYDIAKVESIENANERIAYGVDLYIKRIKEIKKNDDLHWALPSIAMYVILVRVSPLSTAFKMAAITSYRLRFFIIS